jgi:hypothetical protein
LAGVYVGSVWQSANLELGLTPTAWGRFEVDENANSQTIVYRIKSAATEGGLAAASWIAVTGNSNPSTLTLNKWIKIEARFNTTTYTQVPVTYSMILNYFTGNNAVQDAYAIIHKDRYLLSCTSQVGTYSDRIVCMNIREGKGVIFTIFEGWNVASMCNYIHDLIAGSSVDGDLLELWAGTNDNGTAIDAWFIPATLTFRMADNLKMIRKMFLNVNKPTNCTLLVKYSFDAGSEYGFTVAVVAGTGSMNTPLMFPAGVKGKLLDLKFQSNVLDEESEIIGVEIYYRTLNLRKLNVDTISGGGMAQFTWTQATRPTNPYLGQIGYNTDFKGAEQYVGSGLWRILSGEWTVATRPTTTSIAVGSIGYNTDTGYTEEKWTGTEWVS